MDEEEDVVGCIGCMSTSDLCDLFVTYGNNEQTYAQMLKACFDIKVTNDFKYICTNCVENLEKSLSFKGQTVKNMDMLQIIKDEEYLDEGMLEEAEGGNPSKASLRRLILAAEGSEHFGFEDEDADDELEEKHEIEALDETTCIYCDLQLPTVEEVHHHIRLVHGLEPRTGRKVRECKLCGASLGNLEDHLNRCHNVKSEREDREYACHFCDNVYRSKKACFTHLRMKHGCNT